MPPIKTIYKIIKKSNPQYIEADDSIEIDNQNENEHSFKELGLEFEKVYGNKLRIGVVQKDLLIFWNIDDFYKRVSENFLSNNILIINDESEQSLFFDFSTKKTYQQFNLSTKDFLLENAYYYFKTLNCLKEQEHKEDHLFYFVDHFNSSFRKIIFTSLNKEGKLTISYPIGMPRLSRTVSYKKPCERFFHAFSKENKHLPKFIKNEFFKSLTKEKRENRIIKLFENLDEILIVAEQNFELYLNDLSLEKFRTDYIEYKEKYFSQLRDILGKLTTQVVALPLSITAAAFATYRTTDKPILFTLIVVAFLLFSIYSFFLIRLYKFDVLDIKRTFEKDFSKLSKEEYFIKYPNELESFEKVEISIKNRIKNLQNLIFAYTFLLSITNSLFILFSLLQKGVSEGTAYTSSLICLIILCGLLYFLVWKLDKEEK